MTLRSLSELLARTLTGAALMGAMDGMASKSARPRIIALEPKQSPLLTTGKGGSHRVEGIGVGFAPPFLEHDKIHDIRAIDQELAFDMCRRLANQAGIFCGGSTGLNVVGAIEMARELGPGRRVVTLGCDNGTKYLDGQIYR